jgi:NDP-sugar pyrophosphorylase family protein
MKAIVLAGGRGKRLTPLTDIIAKPLLPINGKPVIEQIIKNLRAIDIDDIVVVVGHLGDQIMDYIGNGSKYEVKISYRRQLRQLGTAHALSLAMDSIYEDFLATASDSILPVGHLQELLSYHFKEDCDATLSLKILDSKAILSSATVRLEKDNSISRIIEKPSPEEILSNVASSPLYIFNPVVKDYLPKIKKSKKGEYEIQHAIQMMIDDNLKVKGIISESWTHLSNIEDFLRLNFKYINHVI